ncbi:PTS ascorbate transporter subunit IIC [Clostridium tyrobutyricum]|uniref:Ascorbate-specific PTS system EIIC component n=2 Tax=Clostridium tyrobutyricum TaxID=1519 RepID=W6NLR9_CLOTY|nr:PTS ascorbate transporter subunit IIC [Clostridium tyrobutyricum]AIZ03686.1 PTS family ascorbate porter component IIC [Clostridium tyrobutyricum]AND84648.1 phosphoenolpyruvate-dependent sugar phosphotransferase system, EIIC [Clostridium tyrobutyricum]ANP69251.1 PTS ascorbate transporter subunit IIC [Clostridium tyrobutyricum]MBV4416638.1 PTS ascorbate transporter subunit IIC [Clostridium tyrobutyricum]MBV4421285.1 PTS ascorbate transporter subunit IIC [Clostridium tyrobutyricum]
MKSLLNLFVSIATQPAILVALIAMIGLILQKKKTTEIVQGTIKTFAGFLVLIGGAGILSNSLAPFATMFKFALHVQGVVPSNEAVVAIALIKYGTTTALIMLIGMIVNIILARFTRFKYIFLTGQAMLYVSCLTAVILVSANMGTGIETILLGGLFEGTLLTITPALCQPFMRKITGSDSVAMGHTGNIGYAVSGLIGKLFGNIKHNTEELNIPKSLSFLRDSTVSITLLMSVVYIALAIIAGPSFVESKLSSGNNFIVYALVQAGTFAAGFIVVLQGVRMILGEIVPAFQGIAQKLVPDSKPALDVPIVFPYAPNAVLIGFFVSFIVGTLSMFAMIAIKTTVIIPGVVGHFFCGAAASVYGNSTGGRRGAILGSVVNGLIISWLPLFILPVLGGLKLAASTFADTDYLIPGIILGKVGTYGQSALIFAIIGFTVIVVFLSFILNSRSKKQITED